MTSKVVLKRAATVKARKASMWRKYLMMISGALIVGTTFIVKDMIRDSLKRQMDSVDSALAAKSAGDAEFLVTLNQLKTNQDLRNISDQLPSVANNTVFPRVKLMTEIADVSGAYGQVAGNVKLTSAVLDTLPAEAAPLREQRVKVTTDLEDLHKRLSKTIEQNSVAEPTWTNHALVLLEDVDILAFVLGADPWQQSVIETAKRFRARSDARYLLYTWASYLLCFIGGAVAFAGKWLDMREAT
jgi:hypothetical protein